MHSRLRSNTMPKKPLGSSDDTPPGEPILMREPTRSRSMSLTEIDTDFSFSEDAPLDESEINEDDLDRKLRSSAYLDSLLSAQERESKEKEKLVCDCSSTFFFSYFILFFRSSLTDI